jgi:predicted restriction endonuclease
LPSLIERQRTTTTVLSRQGQPKFRKQILRISQGQCLITGERIGEVLEAAHIIPVTSGGADETDNGICLRVDIHRLFDSGNIRLRPSGELQFSDAIKTSQNYGILPQSIVIPSFIKMANVEWRYKYL